MFHQNGDICNRGDTYFSNGHVTNVSEDDSPCDMKTRVLDSNVTIKLPPTLQGKWASSRVKIEAVFDDAQTRGSLHFSEQLLDSDWGGDIVAISSQANDVVFSVGTKSCIRANLP
jgi:hypothetical protein